MKKKIVILVACIAVIIMGVTISVLAMSKDTEPNNIVAADAVNTPVIQNTMPAVVAANIDNELKTIVGDGKPTIKLVNDKLTQLLPYTIKKFKDVKAPDWFSNSVAKLVGMSGVAGYPDGTFKPQNTTKISEFLKMLMASMGYEQDINVQPWYNNYVKKAKEISIVEPTDNYSYGMDIKRKDMAKIICKILGLKETYRAEKTFTDTDKVELAWINTAFDEYLIRGYYANKTRTFKPLATATRAEVCEMVIRALEYKDDPVGFKDRMKKYYDDLEKAQDEKESQGTYVKNGYTVPNKTDISVAIYEKDPVLDARFMISVESKDFPIDEQLDDLEKILLSKIDKAKVNEVMEYIKKKKARNDGLEPKVFNANNLIIRVSSAEDSQVISVIVSKS